MGIINKLVKFVWSTEPIEGQPTSALPISSSEYGSLRHSLDDLQRQVNRVERQVYRRIAKGDGNFEELNDEDWIKGVK